MSKLTAFLAVLILALPIAACGKKGPPKPPGGESDYPKTYPTS